MALGVPLAFWAKSVAATLIRDLPARSVVPVVIGGAAMSVPALAAAYIPAHRGTRVDPRVALRYE